MVGTQGYIYEIMKVTCFQFFLFLFSLASIQIGAQNYGFEWANKMGATGADYGSSICVDKSGNIYSTGYFYGTVDFNPGIGTFNLSASGGRDIFVQKLDSKGNFIWAKKMGGSNSDYGQSIVADDFGNVYFTGYFHDTANFNSGGVPMRLFSNGGYDCFIQKLDTNGNTIWVKKVGGTGFDYSNSITSDKIGNVYITGSFSDTVDFDPNQASTTLVASGGLDIFIQKLNASGELLWVKQMGGALDDIGSSISVDSEANVYSTGAFKGAVDFNPGTGWAMLNSYGADDIYIQKLDSSGNFRWVKRMGGSYTDEGHSITIDSIGNIFTTGRFTDTVDFDPGTSTFILASNGASDVFIQKLSPTGNLLWAKHVGGTITEFGKDISVDPFGNVVLTGYFAGTVDFDPSLDTLELTSNGGYDIFILKLTPGGDLTWVKQMGGSQDDFGISVSISPNNEIYVIGGFQKAADFDPGIGIYSLSSSGIYDIFIQKLRPCLTSIATHKIRACEKYTWLNGVTYTSNNNTATYIITSGSANGCDSLVALDLSIGLVSDISTSLNGATLMANNTSATYQWLDCSNNYASLLADTSQSFTPTTNGNYAVQLTEKTCIDTSACVAITNIGIPESYLGNGFILFPNPSKQNLTLQFRIMQPEVEATIYDTRGNLLKTVIRKNTDSLYIDLNQPAGVYFVEIKTLKTYKIVKVVKQ